MEQLMLFGVFDTEWLIEHCTKSLTTKEREVLKNTGRIGKMPIITTDEDQIIKQFRMWYNRRHARHFTHYVHHPRNNARYEIWVLRYLRYFKEKE